MDQFSIESAAMASTPISSEQARTTTPGRLVAVIDVGTTSIRMAIGQIDEAGRVDTLETLSQAVSLGKDTFTKGSIESSTTEQCVRVLNSYRDFLAEYQITDPEQVRVEATSAVREAANRASFAPELGR